MVCGHIWEKDTGMPEQPLKGLAHTPDGIQSAGGHGTDDTIGSLTRGSSEHTILTGNLAFRFFETTTSAIHINLSNGT